MPARRILFRTTGSRTTGWGHVVRSMALAYGMRRAGWKVSFLLERSDRDVVRSVAQVFPLFKKSDPEPDWTVFDAYSLGERDRRRTRAAGSRLLCIDDLARGPITADLVVNPNDGVRIAAYGGSRKARLLLGAKYCLLREPFQKRPRRRKPSPRGTNVLLTLGGSDSRRLADRLAAGMPEGMEIRVLRGATAREVVRLMDWADLAVSAAGGTCWELASRGVPILAVIVAKNQQPVAAALERRGVGTSLGWYDRLRPDRLRRSVEALAGDPARRARMGRKGRFLVDGRGVERVVKEIRRWPR